MIFSLNYIFFSFLLFGVVLKFFLLLSVSLGVDLDSTSIDLRGLRVEALLLGV